MILASISMISLKFRGCLLGALIGDCLGAPYEGDFPVSKSILKNYFTKILNDKSGSLQIFPYTDDTAMTFSVAQSLIENEEFNAKDMAKKFVDEYFANPKRGYGMNVVDVFKALRESDYADVFHPAKLQFNGSGSYGNGAAMRIAPIALFSYGKDDAFAKNLSKQCSLITHFHQNGYNGAILQCLAIREALKLDPESQLNPVQFIDNLLEKMQAVEKTINNKTGEEMKPYCTSLQKIKDIFDQNQEDMSEEEIAVYLGNHISAQKSVPTAIYSFLRGFQPLPNFEDNNAFLRSIYFAISVGGDTDTIASMAGSIAGAYHGANLIPGLIQNKCESMDECINLAEKLFELNQKMT